jgi:hypothetical protein
MICRYYLKELFFPSKWEIVVTKKNPFSPNFLDISDSDVRLIPYQDEYWADPFIFIKGNCRYVFFERFYLNKNKGVVAYIQLFNDNSFGEPTDIIEEPFHLSFPFIFESNKKIYIIPESEQSNSISLYEAADFPNKWTKLTNLIDDLNATDPILIEQDKAHYLLLSPTGGKGVDFRSDLLVYKNISKNLICNWHLHTKNKVELPSSCGRNGGVVRVNDKLYRVAQNSEKIYGRSVAFVEFYISAEGYKQFIVHELVPSGFAMSKVHTVNSCCGNYCYDRAMISWRSLVDIYKFRLNKCIKLIGLKYSLCKFIMVSLFRHVRGV